MKPENKIKRYYYKKKISSFISEIFSGITFIVLIGLALLGVAYLIINFVSIF